MREKNRSDAVYILLVIFMYGLWSSVFALGKDALSHAPPVFLTAFRMLLAAALLVGYLVLMKRKELKILKTHFLPLLLLGFFSIYLTNICEFWGLKHISAAKTCFIYSLSPFLAAIFSYFHFGEKINRQKLLGMLIGFLGFVPVLATQNGAEELFSAVGFISWPEISVMGAAAFSVYGWILLRIVVRGKDVSPLAANGVSMLLGGMMALIHSFLIESWSPMPFSAEHFSPFMKGILLMTVISNIICFNLYGFMLRRFTATFLSFMGLLSPIFASFNEWLILGQSPNWMIFLGTGIVSCGLFIVYQAELKQGYISSSAPSEESTQKA